MHGPLCQGMSVSKETSGQTEKQDIPGHFLPVYDGHLVCLFEREMRGKSLFCFLLSKVFRGVQGFEQSLCPSRCWRQCCE